MPSHTRIAVNATTYVKLILLLISLPSLASTHAQQIQLFYDHNTAHVCGPRQSVLPPSPSSSSSSNSSILSGVTSGDPGPPPPPTHTGVLPTNCFQNSTEARSFNPVYMNAGCAVNATGFALCTTENYTAIFPTPVLDAFSFARRSCFLFMNGTVGCCGHGPPCEARGEVVIPEEAGGKQPQGFRPVPLQPVAEGVTIAMMTAGEHFACYLFSNQTVACASTRYPEIVSDAPPAALTRSVLMLSGGQSHVCILYDDYSPYCWGTCLYSKCINGNLQFSYISAGPTATCGVQLDGSILCLGNRLTSAILDAPHGVYSQIQVNVESAVALSAVDASVSIWSSSKTVSATSKAVPTVATSYLTVPCVPQLNYNPALSPSFACWGDQGQAAGAVYWYLTNTPIRSMAIGPQLSCLQFVEDASIVCLHQEVPTELQRGNTNLIGVVPGTSNDQPYAWKTDGVLVTWSKQATFLPASVNNNTAFQWSSFSFAMYGSAVCGILQNGKPTCVVGSSSTQDPCAGYVPPSQLLTDYAALTHQPLDSFVHMAVYALQEDAANCQNVDNCGVLQNQGSIILCAGRWFSEAARAVQNSSILVLSFPTLLGSSVYVKNVTIQKKSADVPFSICALANSGEVICWLLSSPSPLKWQLTNGYVPDGARLSTIFADESLMYALYAADSTLTAWNPLDFNTAGTANTDLLPSMLMEVAPQFHYRVKAGPILPCPPGTYSLGAGNTSPGCSGQCSPGYFGNTSMNDSPNCAHSCPRGSFCPPGSALPTLCPAGTYGKDEQLMFPSCSGTCLAGYYCPAGSTAPWDAPCMPGSFTLDPSLPCQLCAPNTYSSLAAPICSFCPSGSFAPQTGSTECITCAVTGLDCTSSGQVRIESGYWVDMSSLARNFTDPTFVPYLCPPDYCDLQGGAVQNTSAGAGLISFTNPCSLHRSLALDNALCGRCDDGYHEWNSMCTDCPTLNVPILLLLIFCSAVFVAILHRVSQSSSSSARVNILVYFVQSCLILLRAKSNTELAKVFAFLHVFNLSALQPTGANCLAQLSASQLMLLHGLVPLFTLVLLYTFAIVQWLIYGFQSRRNHAANPVPWYRYIRTTIAIALFAFQQICFTLLEYLQCVDVGPYQVVFNTPSISCLSEGYRSVRPVVIVLFLFMTTILPIALASFLYSNRKLIQQDEILASEDTEQDALSNNLSLSVSAAPILPHSSFARRFDGLYIMFRPGCFYWSVVLILRRVLLITIAVIMLSQPIYQFLLFNCCCLLILLLQLWMQPFRLPLDNQLEAFALLAVQLLSLLLSSQTTPQSNLPLSIQLLAGALLSLPLAALVVFCVHHFLHQSDKGRRLYQRCIGTCRKKEVGILDQEIISSELPPHSPSASEIKILREPIRPEELVAMDTAAIGTSLATSARSSSLRARLLETEDHLSI